MEKSGVFKNANEIRQVFQLRDEVTRLRSQNSDLKRHCFLLETLIDSIAKASGSRYGVCDDPLLDVDKIRTKLIREGNPGDAAGQKIN